MGKKIKPDWRGFDTREMGIRRWRLNQFVVDEAARELSTPEGVIPLEALPFDLLLALLRHPDGLVPKLSLIQCLWSGRVVRESQLAKCLTKLRQALGDEHQELICTIYGYGYRLMARPDILPPGQLFRPRPGAVLPLHPQIRLLQARSNAEGSWAAEMTGAAVEVQFIGDALSTQDLRQWVQFTCRARAAGADAAAACDLLLDWDQNHEPRFAARSASGTLPLPEWVKQRGGFAHWPEHQRLALVARAARRLAALHGGGLHLSGLLQPGCLLVDTQGDVRLAPLPVGGSGGLLNQIYLAPEALTPDQIGAAADVFSMGVILFRCLSGGWIAPPVPGWDWQIPNGALKKLITALTHPDPTKRPTAKALAQELEGLAAPARQDIGPGVRVKARA